MGCGVVVSKNKIKIKENAPSPHLLLSLPVFIFFLVKFSPKKTTFRQHKRGEFFVDIIVSGREGRNFFLFGSTDVEYCRQSGKGESKLMGT